jgi:hypothetical protein
LHQLRRLSYPLQLSQPPQLSQVLPLQQISHQQIPGQLIPHQRPQLRCQPQGNCRLQSLATLLNLET